MKFIKIIIISYLVIFMNGCSVVYLGLNSYDDFDPEKQPDSLGKEVKIWEDGKRTNSKNGEYEWWYFDAKLDDGSVIVAYFWTLSAIKELFYIGVNYNHPDGTEYKKIKFFNKKDIFINKEQCDLKYDENIFTGDLQRYKIRIEPDDFDGFGFEINLDSNVPSYRPQDGIISAGKDFFAWLAAVPNGDISGNLTYGNKTRKISGDGYHDHNWGNIPLQRLFDNWVWFRGTIDHYTIIGFELNTTEERGGYSIPGLFIGDSTGIVHERFGQNGIFTAKENLITDLYKKNNEALFSKFKIITKDNYYIEVDGYDVIENLALFEITNNPLLPLIFKFSSLDPYYTRYKSNVILELPNGHILDGQAVLEIMDLK
ncbi:MAG: hypothetical protein CMF96_07730 [Candidatus Marinimicrobia bacterium]|nr:hypothetical protein [Candidatus Neomarinimicrobiota bacterium]|tara:strand:+ start:908 stop:2017 length:1110 start_codon:yes stop_codon:yes gene_type:complete